MSDERSESLPQHRDAPRAIGLIALATALWGTIGVVVALVGFVVLNVVNNFLTATTI